jgi:hypothetical protein
MLDVFKGRARIFMAFAGVAYRALSAAPCFDTRVPRRGGP